MLTVVLATQLFGFKVLTVQSDSMEPALERGDIVVSRPVSASEIERRDIIVFEAGEGRFAIAHRVIAVIRTVANVTDSATGQVATTVSYQFRTKGDANNGADQTLVRQDQVLGEVWVRAPGFGFGANGVSLQRGLVIFAALMGMAWVSWELYQRAGRQNNSTHQDEEPLIQGPSQ